MLGGEIFHSVKSSANIRCPMEAISLCNVVKFCTEHVARYSAHSRGFTVVQTKTIARRAKKWRNTIFAVHLGESKQGKWKMYKLKSAPNAWNRCFGELKPCSNRMNSCSEVATWSSSRDDDPIAAWYFSSINTFSRSGIRRRCLPQWIQHFIPEIYTIRPNHSAV